MRACPFSTMAELKSIAFDNIRWGARPDPGKAVELDYRAFAAGPPDRLWHEGRKLRLIGAPRLSWERGFIAEACGQSESHFHADLETPTICAHIDYFKFVRHGPLMGIEGFAVSQDGTLLAVGGHWGMPPAGGRNNWPLGVDLGPVLLCVHTPFRVATNCFWCDGLTLWEKPIA